VNYYLIFVDSQSVYFFEACALPGVIASSFDSFIISSMAAQIRRTSAFDVS
jgi:hypothetical protein